MIQRTAALGIMGFVAMVLSAGPAAAAAPGVLEADAPVAAWSVSPSDENGKPTGQSRFELEPKAGETLTEHVLVSNASTIAQQFVVYAADAINTSSGGYDLQPHSALPVDVATWVKLDQPTLSLPALGSAVVSFTVAVPSGVVPGDHAGGIVVSLAKPQANDQGVVMDERVALRLNVRVPGTLTPTLTVSNVHASQDISVMPFGRTKVTVTYDVKNTGNVKIVGAPRVRLTGPFGAALASFPATGADASQAHTGEILPGQGFTAQQVFDDVPALGFGRAVVDLDMTAAPGPQTQIPLVSSTGSASYVAVPLTGLALVVIVVVVGVVLWRRWRWRRIEGERLWNEMMAEKAEGAGAAPAGALMLVIALGVGAVVGLASVVAGPAGPAAADSSDGSATVQLTVPAPPSATAAPSSAGTGGSSSPWSPSGGSVPGGSVQSQSPAASAPTPTPSVTQEGVVVAPTGAAGSGPDLTWVAQRGLTPGQLALVVLGVIAALAAGLIGVRRYLKARTVRVAAMHASAAPRAAA